METKEKIIEHSLTLFANNSYENASLNDLVKSANISKGIIYHYFKNKEELYLYCVNLCFEAMYSFYCSKNINSIDDLMNCRLAFFENNPTLKKIFFNAILKSPTSIKDKVYKLKTKIDNFHEQIYLNYLKTCHLREGISLDYALKYLRLISNSFNDLFINSDKDISILSDEHEENITKLIDVYLHGVLKEG